MKKLRVISILMALFMFVGIAFAETPSTLKRQVWNAKQTFKHGIEVSGDVTLDAGVISATEIADVERNIDLNVMTFWTPDASGPVANHAAVAGSHFPGWVYNDAGFSVVWLASGSTTSIGRSFILPETYSTGLGFRVLVTSDTDVSYSSLGIDWQLWVNRGSATIDAAPFDQTAVYNTVSTPSASNSILTLTADATALAGIQAGDMITLWLWNADGRASGSTADSARTTEIKAVNAFYTSTQ
uniref:Uncharacterized protein n=1 Tax=viral metagenome TaxID=1070528 RepID=A0A6H1ZM38_9ZZZZ